MSAPPEYSYILHSISNDAQFSIVQHQVNGVVNDVTWVPAHVFIDQHDPRQGYRLMVQTGLTIHYRNLFSGLIEFDWRFHVDAFSQTVAWYPSGSSRHFQVTFPDFVDLSNFLKVYMDGMILDRMQSERSLRSVA